MRRLAVENAQDCVLASVIRQKPYLTTDYARLSIILINILALILKSQYHLHTAPALFNQHLSCTAGHKEVAKRVESTKNKLTNNPLITI